MNARTLFLVLSGGALVWLLAKALQTAPTHSSAPAAPPQSPVASLVEQTLHQHEGEQSPFVEAFAEALHPKDA